MRKGKRKIRIETPRGVIYTQASNGGKVSAKLEWNPAFASRMGKDSKMRRDLLIQNVSGA